MLFNTVFIFFEEVVAFLLLFNKLLWRDNIIVVVNSIYIGQQNPPYMWVFHKRFMTSSLIYLLKVYMNECENSTGATIKNEGTKWASVT